MYIFLSLQPFSSIIFNLAMGVALWSLLEYCLHRWLFHIDTSKFGWKVHTMHFLLHGLHHKVPFDSHRLVFPPVPAFILASLFYQPLFIVFDFPRLIVAGGLIGKWIFSLISHHHNSPNSVIFAKPHETLWQRRNLSRSSLTIMRAVNVTWMSLFLNGLATIHMQLIFITILFTGYCFILIWCLPCYD